MKSRRRYLRPKTSRGVPWSEVRLDEAQGMVRDGIEAAALLAAWKAAKGLGAK
jgi:hypothetical protein